MLNLLFSRFKWWRQWKGGIWWLIDFPAVGEIGASWLPRAPKYNERVHDVENYTVTDSVSLSKREFWERIVNIACNGQWKDDLGLDNVTLFTFLDNLYWATAREATSEMEKRDFSYEDVQQLLQMKQ